MGGREREVKLIPLGVTLRDSPWGSPIHVVSFVCMGWPLWPYGRYIGYQTVGCGVIVAAVHQCSHPNTAPLW